MELIPNNKLLNLSGKTAIVTGGSLGIGYGISFRLAEAGANVIIASRNLDEANEAVGEIVKQGFKAEAITADISKEEDVKNLVSKVVEKFGSIEILVNNAGVYPFAPLTELTSEMFDKTIAINLRGVFLCTKYVSEIMIKKGKGGKIINISSIDAIHPSSIGLSHYDASKHGVWGFTKNVALELSKYNIQINAVAPGGIMTPGTSTAKFVSNKPVKPERNPEPIKMDVPMGRMGVPDDVGKVVLFLASDMATYLTGSQIVVDGGYLLK